MINFFKYSKTRLNQQIRQKSAKGLKSEKSRKSLGIPSYSYLLLTMEPLEPSDSNLLLTIELLDPSLIVLGEKNLRLIGIERDIESVSTT